MGCTDLLLIEPAPLLSSGLKHLLLGSSYVVVQEEQRTTALLAPGSKPLPALVLCGPGANLCTEAERAWVRRQRIGSHRSRFVVLADLMDASLVHHLASSGVDAVLSQDVSGDVLRRSLDLVMLGQALFPPLASCSMSETPLRHEANLLPFPTAARHGLPLPRRTQEREVVLSQREKQVLRWLVDGASNKVIARELQITETTVKAHIKGVLRKVRASNRTQAAIWALGHEVQVAGASGEPTLQPYAGETSRYAAR